VSLPKIQNSLEKLEARLAEMHAEVKRVGDQIKSNRGEANTKFDSSMQDQQAKHGAIKTDLSSMRADMGNMRNDVALKMSSLEKRLASLEETLRSLEKSLREA
jgi:chromosome segregation ATPase